MIGSDFVGQEQANRVVESFPAVPSVLDGWLERLMASGDWLSFNKLVNLAAYVRPPGPGELLCRALDSRAVSVNREDMVEILGELGDTASVGSIVRAIHSEYGTDGPHYNFCRRCPSALAAIGGDDARRKLSDVTGSGWPNVLRWYAAVELGIEEDLGFDEDEMLR